MLNQTGSMDGQKRTKHGVLYLNHLNTHIYMFTHAHEAFYLLQVAIFSYSLLLLWEHKKLFILSNDISTETEGQSRGSAHSQQSPLFLVTHTVSYTPANSLLSFNACQRRLKRTEVHNNEENKQADENMDREKRREEKLSLWTYKTAEKDIFILQI